MTKKFKMDKQKLIKFNEEFLKSFPNLINITGRQYLYQHIDMLIRQSLPEDHENFNTFKVLSTDTFAKIKALTQKFIKTLSAEFTKTYQTFIKQLSKILSNTSAEDASACFSFLTNLLVCVTTVASLDEEAKRELYASIDPNILQASGILKKLVPAIEDEIANVDFELNEGFANAIENVTKQARNYSSKPCSNPNKRALIATIPKHFTTSYIYDHLNSLILLPTVVMIETLNSERGVGTLPKGGISFFLNKSTLQADDSAEPSLGVFFEKLGAERFIDKIAIETKKMSRTLEKKLHHPIHTYAKQLQSALQTYHAHLNHIENVGDEMRIDLDLVTKPNKIKKDIPEHEKCDDFYTHARNLNGNLERILTKVGTKKQISQYLIQTGTFTAENIKPLALSNEHCKWEYFKHVIFHKKLDPLDTQVLENEESQLKSAVAL